MRSWLPGGLGYLVLLGTVAFWWGGLVFPVILGLIFPEVLSGSEIYEALNPERDGSLTNGVSSAALLVVAVLACLNVVVGRRRAAGGIDWLGWVVLALAAIFLVAEEFDSFIFKGRDIVAVAGQEAHWLLLTSPLIVTFLIAISHLIYRYRKDRDFTFLMSIAILAWMLAILHDGGPDFLLERYSWIRTMKGLLEETLEFSGMLLISLSSIIALGGKELGILRRRLLVSAVAGSLAIVAVLGILAGTSTFGVRLIDTRHDPGSAGGFYVALHDEMSAIQELRGPEFPIKRLRIRLADQGKFKRPMSLTWRVIDGGTDGEFLREGRLDIATTDDLGWRSIEFDPPLSGLEGRRLGLQLVADVETGSHIRVSATKANLYPEGRLWVNGEPTWPGQSLQIMAYSPPELTRSKLRALWQMLSSDWRWPAVLADLTVSLTLILVVPVLLMVCGWHGLRVGRLLSGLR
ncbi:MAG: hypothetical protein OXG64_02605 [Chloroflexi bacterium]|nr:hypothetical protein [Chloroflexota bacterium]